MTSKRLALALPLLLASAAVTGCGGGVEGGDDPKSQLKSAREAIRDNDHEAALKTFEGVLGSDADAETKYRAKRDSLICVAQVRGADDFNDELATLTEEYGDRINADELAKISFDLTDLKFYDLAVNVIEAAKNEFIPRLKTEEEREKVDADLRSVALAISKTEAGAGLISKLEALGYLGN